jgi:glycerol-3-phosphate dehydrogenase (NAD(P)+)
MTEKENILKHPVGIIGSGSFGISIANLLAENVDEIIVFARRAEVREAIRQRSGMYSQLSPKVRATDNLEEVALKCQIIFPVVPSRSFRDMIRELSPFLTPSHFLIHGTKGLDTVVPEGSNLKLKSIKTMSQVIEEESVVCRIGCLSGPNLSAEILEGQPAATLLASRYTEVIKAGQILLRSPRFQVYGTHDIIGAELAGVLKNVIALAAGLLGGKGLGKNIWALLITRGLSEMIHIGKAMGAEAKAFLGVAGIGDLVATASGIKSRNYTAGMRIAQGEKLEAILNEASEMVEGIKTLETVHFLIQQLGISAPIFEVTYRVIFKGMNLDRAIGFLMTYPYEVDVDFM